MPVPALVYATAGAGYVHKPGGVIVVAAADVVSAHTGLSTEADALSAAGTVVREAQEYNGIIAAGGSEYASMDDTLDLSAAPLKDNVDYGVFITYRIEGGLDQSDGVLLRACNNEYWSGAGVIGIHGGAYYSEASPSAESRLMPAPHYRILSLFDVRISEFTDPLGARAYRETGTTVEILLDQVWFIPDVFVSGAVEEKAIPGPGQFGQFDTSHVEDGDDGGDDWGKFTLLATPPANPLTSGGDYQRKSDGDDAEYFTKTDPVKDIEYFQGPTFFAPTQIPGHMYSMHVAGYRGERTWSEDTFDNRDTSGGIAPITEMGVSPEGFGYQIGHSFGGAGVNEPELYVDGTKAIMKVGTPLQIIDFVWGPGGQSTAPDFNNGQRFILYDQWEWSGRFKKTMGDAAEGIMHFNFQAGTRWNFHIAMGMDEEWTLDQNTYFGPPHPWSKASQVGFRFRISRYRLQVRIWDADSTEPSTWDEDVFFSHGGGLDYPYGDDEIEAMRQGTPVGGLIMQYEAGADFGSAYPVRWEIYNLKASHDPYGDPASMFVRVEQPEGTSLGDIEIPYGAPYLAYWGNRNWTEYNPSEPAYCLSFSTRTWNDPAAADIQRAETYYFLIYYWVEPLNLVSMNWRSGDRSASAYRVLVGEK